MRSSFLSLITGRSKETPLQSKAAPATPAPGAADVAPGPLPRYLVRQLVLDGHSQLLGYSLCLREGGPVPVLPGAHSDEQIHDEALLAGAMDLAQHPFIEGKSLFLPIAPATLHNPILAELPSAAILMLPGARLGEAEWQALDTLARAGRRFGLDLSSEASEFQLPPADVTPFEVIRFDVSHLDALQLGERLDHLAGLPDKRLIASGVDVEEIFTACQRLPFEGFQGGFFTQVQGSRAHRLDSHRLRVIELLNLTLKGADIAELERPFRLAPDLSFRLLRYINSPAVGLRQSIHSIAEALILMGHKTLYRWLTLLLFACDPESPRDQTLLRNALVRARLCELVGAQTLPRDTLGGVFIVGMFSLLDALLNLPMPEAIAELNLDGPIREALLDASGPYAPALGFAIACENGDTAALQGFSERLGMQPDVLNTLHLEALSWASNVSL